MNIDIPALMDITQNTKKQKEDKKSFKIQTCKDCQACELKRQCLYNYSETKDKTRNKRTEVNHVWMELKKKIKNNIHAEKGLGNMIIRTIQPQTHL